VQDIAILRIDFSWLPVRGNVVANIAALYIVVADLRNGSV
jgi:hypothetical protein